MKIRDLKRPIDVPTRETADFIGAHVEPGSSILEIGCGNGDVGAELMRRGFYITAVDPDSEAIKTAKSRGLKAICGEWPETEVGNFDSVAFTRSLHHIEDLGGAIEKAVDSLSADGVFLLEDFAFNLTDQQTLDWFLQMIRSERIKSLVRPAPHEFATRMLTAADPLKEWERDKHHDLHSAEEMKAAIGQRLRIISEASVPYFYRYLVPVFPASREAAEMVERTLAEEIRLGGNDEIVLVGRRIVARKL